MAGTGLVTITKGGLTAPTAAMTVTAGGVTVTGGSLSIAGNSAVTSGTLSLTSSSTSLAGLDVYSSLSMTADSIIAGRTVTGATTGSAMTLKSGVTTEFQVRNLIIPFSPPAHVLPPLAFAGVCQWTSCHSSW